MIYLDHAATTPLSRAAREAMAPWVGVPANPSSLHRLGQRAAAAVERARADVAGVLGVHPGRVVFTSGATEAVVTFLRGASRGGRVALSAVEHPCVSRCAGELTEPWPWAVGADLRAVPGAVPSDVQAAALMAASHETGVLQPVEEAREVARAAGVSLLVDAAHALGKVPSRWLGALDADGLVLSAHKVGGPVGVGALVLREPGPFPALLPGSQERGRRGGTVDVIGVVGFAAALVDAESVREACVSRWLAQRAVVEQRVRELGGRVLGADVPRVASTLGVVFPGLLGEAVVQGLDLAGVAVSAGAACASGSTEPSPLLAAVGDPDPRGLVRVSLGVTTTDEDVDGLCAALPGVVEGLRRLGW